MTVHRLRLQRAAGSRTPLAPRHRSSSPRSRRRMLLADERGDVPGWVMITLMTAAIVVALWAVASDQIVQIFNNAMEPFLNRKL
jgi:hypothetical protein